MDYGAFVDVGVKKDGLLRNDAFGECQRLAAGDKITVVVASLDGEKQKIRLSATWPRPVGTKRMAAPRQQTDSVSSEAAIAARAARAAAERASEAKARAAAERAEAEAEVRRRVEAIEAMMVQDAFDRASAAEAARVDAGMVLAAAEVARGVPVPARKDPADSPLEVLVEKRVAGRLRVLYKMPWPRA